MRRYSAALALVSLLLLAGCDKGPSMTGSAERNFTLTEIHGKSITLSDYRGKVVMLEFWATWCAPCRVAVPELAELHMRFKDRGFVLIALSLDKDISKVRDFAERYSIPYPVVIDDRNVNSRYGVFSIPTVVIIDRQGDIVKKHPGFAAGLGEDFARLIEELL